MKTDNETELKPCPFCGSDAEFERVGTGRVSEIINCTECHCSLESSDQDHYSGSSWNTRPEPTLKSSEGLDLVKKLYYRLIAENNYVKNNLIIKELAKIRSTITPTPETASEGERWEINPKSAKDESEDVVYLILVEEDSHPLIGTYADNYGYFATTDEMINIKNVYAIKEFKYPTQDNEGVL